MGNRADAVSGFAHSVMVPFYDEAGVIEKLHRRIVTVMDGLGRPYEMVFVDDRSRDEMAAVLGRISARHSGVSGWKRHWRRST